MYEVRVDGGGLAAGGPDELLQARLQLLPHAPVVVVVLQDPVQALQQKKKNNNRQSIIIINSSAVLRIHDILVWIRIRGSMPLTSGSGSCYFRH